MTVASSTRKAGPFLGNGVATTFPFTFKVFSRSDLALTLTDAAGVTTPLTLDSHYSVTLNADQDNNPGGTITYPISGAPLLTGQTLVGIGAQPYEQQTDISNAARFLPQVLEDSLDKQVIMIQQLAALLSRALLLAPADSASGTLPALSLLKNHLLQFNATTGLMEPSTITASQIASAVSAFYAGAAGPLDALSFIAAGTGAVSRSAQAKLREVAVSVKDFGATGNGATDDTAAIQAALTAAGANGTVYFPRGAYLVSSTLTGYANQTLRGDGSNTTMIKRVGNYGDTIVFGSAAASCGHVCIESMWFKHGSADYTPGVNSIPDKVTSGAHIRLWDSQSSILNDVWIWRMQYGVVYEGGSFGMLDKCDFYGIWDPLFAAAQEGIAQVLYRKSTVGGIPTSMKIRGSYLTGAAALARSTNFSPSTGTVAKNITALVGSQYGVQINCVEDFEMSGCYSSGQAQNSVLVNNTTDPVLELRFYGNFFDCAGQAIIQFSPASGNNASYVSINGNTFNGEDTGVRAISFDQAGATFGTHSASIIGNQFFAFIGTPILASGLAKAAISGNTIGGYNDLNVTPSDPTWCAAVFITAPSRDITVNNNVIGFGTFTYKGVQFGGNPPNVIQYDNINAGATLFDPQTPPTITNGTLVNTQLGVGAPFINMLKITGTTSPSQGGIVVVAHGLVGAKILAMEAQVFHSTNSSITPGYKYSAGYHFNLSQDGTSVQIVNIAAESANILSKPFTVLVTYEG